MSLVTGDQVAAWLSRLVQIPSVNPIQAGPRAGEPGEQALATAIAGWFRSLGGEVAVEEVLPGRPNVYGLWRGRTDRWVGVDTHLDTVSVEQMTTEPFSGEVRDGRVWGRGAVDTKASLAVVLALLEAARERDLTPEPSLFLAATVDEEVNAQGAPACADWIRRRELPVSQMVVSEPTLCGPVIAHKGALRLEFTLQGQPAHSSQPHLGKNAITAAAHLILALDREHQRLQEADFPPPLGSPTLTVTICRGGVGMNVVPDACTLIVDRRLVAVERSESIAAQIREYAERSSPLPLRTEALKQIDAFYQDPDTPWIRDLAAWSGRAPQAVPYGTNAWAYRDLIPECVVMGPGSIDQAHGVEEWVEISELEKMAGIYARWWGLEG